MPALVQPYSDIICHSCHPHLFCGTFLFPRLGAIHPMDMFLGFTDRQRHMGDGFSQQLPHGYLLDHDTDMMVVSL